MNLDDLLHDAAVAIREPDTTFVPLRTNAETLRKLDDDVELMGALERAYRAAEQAERLGRPIDAATYFRVAADQNIGDAAVRLATLLSELGEAEADEWFAVAEQEGFTTFPRERFLQHAAAVTVGITKPLRNRAHVSPAEVSRIEAATRALRTLDRQYGGIACHAAVLDHVRALDPFRGTRNDRLNAAIADAYDLAGWTAFDAGQPAAAHTYFATAMSLAGENTALMADIMSHAGRMYLHHDERDTALQLFQLGQLHARNSGSAAAIAKLTALEKQARGCPPEIDLTALRQQKRVRGQTIVLTALARNRLADGDSRAAAELAERALDVSARLRSQRANDHLRALGEEAEELADRIAARLACAT
ncbi:hypothetical protein Lesp02_32100 [Lentzea sp. NBRC 105346]|uniref:hypothetical protein n=1 Tax=Lentzea sp. NBRC 105346 TaxID=3032205 RepID=UPI0024A16E5E|nr:hypothetical protein [Lentzea sp. NBRC 105346]GLZ31021.1 hypothetical protein Lesp02_32100 [Lentzea sp. NBRC 105346]